MSYFRHIDNGEGSTKLFVGGVHGNEGKTAFKFLDKLKEEDFSKGQIFIYNFDKSPYISTLDERYFESPMGKTILELIEDIKPDFYTELHCYNIKNFEKLTSMDRFNTIGVPPLIDMGNHVLMGSISPIIRTKYFSVNNICKTLEFPCLDKLNDDVVAKYNFDMDLSFDTYFNILKTLAREPNRKSYENKMVELYPKQVDLAIDFAKKIFGEFFPPY